MRHITFIPLILILVSSCTLVREYSTIYIYKTQHKVLLFAPTLQCSNTHKPIVIKKWVHEKDIDKMIVICDINCNCKLVKEK